VFFVPRLWPKSLAGLAFAIAYRKDKIISGQTARNSCGNFCVSDNFGA
jgi:hypothetical protein